MPPLVFSFPDLHALVNLQRACEIDPANSDFAYDYSVLLVQARQYRTAIPILENPVKAGLVESPEEYPYGFSYLAKRKAAGDKQAAEKLFRELT